MGDTKRHGCRRSVDAVSSSGGNRKTEQWCRKACQPADLPTRKLMAKRGERIRIRYMNQGEMIHPMHLHGLPQRVFAREGYPLPYSYLVGTVLVAPGERWDVIVDCTEAGVWALHCHILFHAESPHGMFGMTTALVVEP